MSLVNAQLYLNPVIDLENYINELRAHLKTGEAREHTYRPAQAQLFEAFKDIQAANDQARTAHGATDFVFRKKSNLDVVLGYAEAKDIDADLDKTEKTEQLERYAGYNNLILTNYIEFRFYRNGKKYAQVEIAKRDGLKLMSIPENFNQLIDEIDAFFTQPPEVIKNAKRLSEIMGGKARRIRFNINILLEANSKNPENAPEISKVYGLMRQLLVHDLEPDNFADMYAQTLVYGLFVARYNDKSPKTFSRAEARELIPNSNPFLREFFDHIAGPRFEKGLGIIVDELCQVFEVSDVSGLIDKYLKLNSEDKADAKDPIIHFYEDFLGEYNPKERKKMGAYYTPMPVVRYMVRAVDEVLKKEFGIADGLADSSRITNKVALQGKKKVEQSFHRVQVLDPATGTGTFLNEIIKFVHQGFEGQEGLWPAYAKEDLIPRLHGFELMMGAYTIAHLKLGITLKNLGVDDIGKRVGVYLTNSLEEGIPTQPDLFSFGLADAVTHEAQEAAHIKSERPIMVVIGNPPYSGVSSNNFEHANRLVDKYKVEPGGQQKLQERNPKWLNDDYVKFIALAEDLISKNGEGVLAFITNHGYLDNPTFRGMRWHLSQTFDSIDIVDLHGNAKKKETAPDGSKDENVFDIMQGVSIIIATKSKDGKKDECAVHVADIYGKRENKFEVLNEATLQFVDVELDRKQLYFVDKNIEGQSEYEEGFSLANMFTSNSIGVVTSADSIFISDDWKKLTTQLLKAKHSGLMKKAVKKLENHIFSDEKIKQIDYRPFDRRFIYYAPEVLERPRTLLMTNFTVGANRGLIFRRQSPEVREPYVFVASCIVADGYIRSDNKGGETVAPLYLYDDQGNRSSNLDQTIVKDIQKTVPKADDQSIFDYIYGVLHSPTYREKYKEFLKIDFPRVPYPKDQKEFDCFAKAGKELSEIHLMISVEINKLITTYPVAGNNEVEKLKFQNGKVYINETQYFGGVPEIAWNFYIGGYQPAQKWLKDRKGRALSADDIKHYQKIIKALVETDRIMKEIG